MKLGYRPALDGLRGIAIALVIGIHAFGWPADGQMGVDLFFVLSGFLITTLLLDEHSANGRVDFRGFYVRRARRLLPALVALLAVFVTVAAVTRQQPHTALISALAGLGFTMNILRAWGLTTTSNGLGHLWSLAAEDQFYLIWPVILLVVVKARRSLAAAVLLIGLAVMTLNADRFAPSIRIEVGPDTRPTGLLIGCLLAVLWTRYRGHPRLRLVALLLLPLAVFIAVQFTFFMPATIFKGGATLFAVCVAVVVVAALEAPAVAAVLSFRPLVWLGMISYSLYLWHLPILVWSGAEGRGGLSATVAVAVSVIAAVLSYRLVEQPFRRRRAPRIELAPVTA